MRRWAGKHLGTGGVQVAGHDYILLFSSGTWLTVVTLHLDGRAHVKEKNWGKELPPSGRNWIHLTIDSMNDNLEDSEIFNLAG